MRVIDWIDPFLNSGPCITEPDSFRKYFFWFLFIIWLREKARECTSRQNLRGEGETDRLVSGEHDV